MESKMSPVASSTRVDGNAQERSTIVSRYFAKELPHHDSSIDRCNAALLDWMNDLTKDDRRKTTDIHTLAHSWALDLMGEITLGKSFSLLSTHSEPQTLLSSSNTTTLSDSLSTFFPRLTTYLSQALRMPPTRPAPTPFQTHCLETIEDRIHELRSIRLKARVDALLLSLDNSNLASISEDTDLEESMTDSVIAPLDDHLDKPLPTIPQNILCTAYDDVLSHLLSSDAWSEASSTDDILEFCTSTIKSPSEYLARAMTTAVQAILDRAPTSSSNSGSTPDFHKIIHAAVDQEIQVEMRAFMLLALNKLLPQLFQRYDISLVADREKQLRIRAVVPSML